MVGLGVDPEHDALVLEGTVLSTTFDLSAKVPPPDAFMWGAVLVRYRRYFAPMSSALRHFTAVSFGGGVTLQGAVVLPSLAVAGQVGIRFFGIFSLAASGAYSAPFPAAPIGLTFQIGAP